MKSQSNQLRSHAALDVESRVQKAARIMNILEINTGKSLKVLDVGTGSGHISQAIGKQHQVTSVDVNDERQVKSGYVFKQVSGVELPFKNGEFDVVISNQVIEHIPTTDQQKHIDELLRVLKSGGVLYLATPNRFWLMDPHTRLVGINWMPRSLANIYCRLLAKGSWDIFPVSFSWLRKRLSGRSVTIWKSSYDVLDSIDSDNSVKSRYRVIKQLLPTSIMRRMAVLYPSCIFILKK